MWASYPYMFALLLTLSLGGDLEEDKYGVKYASTCEVCKVWIVALFYFVLALKLA